MKHLFAFLMLEFSALSTHAAFNTTLTNFKAKGEQVTPYATDGNAVDAHDGKIDFFEGLYYLDGTSYDCGFEWQSSSASFCGFKSYSSPDLVHWTDKGLLFDAKTPTGQNRCGGNSYGCYRPHVIYNASTHLYVLWVNVYDNKVGFRVFTSDKPFGPFTEIANPTHLANSDAPQGALNNGDLDLFVDDNDTAYVAFANWRDKGSIIVEQLNSTYTSGVGKNVTGITGGSTEAPALFKRKGVYYLTYSDPNCGYCSRTGSSYKSATKPLGPWTGVSGSITQKSCGGQPSFVSALTWSSEKIYLYASDLWNNADK